MVVSKYIVWKAAIFEGTVVVVEGQFTGSIRNIIQRSAKCNTRYTYFFLHEIYFKAWESCSSLE